MQGNLTKLHVYEDRRSHFSYILCLLLFSYAMKLKRRCSSHSDVTCAVHYNNDILLHYILHINKYIQNFINFLSLYNFYWKQN